MKEFTLQLQCWQDCNLSCVHCWRDAKYNHIKLELERIENQIGELYQHICENIDIFNLKFSGGEPFLYIENIIKFISHLKLTDKLRVHILTNATLIKEEHIKALEPYKDNLHFQVSIDGLKNTHNKIRGEGSFEITYKNAMLLHQKGFNVRLQAVINEHNIKELKQIIKLFTLSPIPYFQIRKTIRKGRGVKIKEDFEISKEMYNTIADMLHYINEHKKTIGLGCDSEAALKIDDRLKNVVHNCGVKRGSILGIEPNGDIFLCPRLPIKIGNIYKDNLVDILTNEYLKNTKKIGYSPICEKCDYLDKCNGGDLCSLHAYYKDIE